MSMSEEEFNKLEKKSTGLGALVLDALKDKQAYNESEIYNKLHMKIEDGGLSNIFKYLQYRQHKITMRRKDTIRYFKLDNTTDTKKTI